MTMPVDFFFCQCISTLPLFKKKKVRVFFFSYKMKLPGVLSLFITVVLGSATFEISPNFRSAKNVMFSCMYGGSSHVSWVMTILEELSLRGHSAFYLTRVKLENKKLTQGKKEV